MYRMSAKVLGWFMFIWCNHDLTSCGIESNIEGNDNEVENKIQKGVFNMDFSSSGEGSCGNNAKKRLSWRR